MPPRGRKKTRGARGEIDGLLPYDERVLRVEQAHAAANNNLALVYVERGGDLKKAERLVRRALAAGGPSTPYALDTLAAIYARQGRAAEAARALEEAEALVPPADEALRNRLAQARKGLSKIQ